jgi:hypothetical protein
LIRVEDGKTLEEWDDAWLFAGLRGAPTFIVGDEAISIDHHRFPFAFHHMAAASERLAEGEPVLSGKALLDDSAHRISTLIPEYPRWVEALRGIASDALIAAVPMAAPKECGSSAMILSVISV